MSQLVQPLLVRLRRLERLDCVLGTLPVLRNELAEPSQNLAAVEMDLHLCHISPHAGQQCKLAIADGHRLLDLLAERMEDGKLLEIITGADAANPVGAMESSPAQASRAILVAKLAGGAHLP